MDNKKAAVFIILGQSNAVGHGIPMTEEDVIKTPLKNVFGLRRKDNLSFDNTKLVWSNYVSADMNLGEEQDNTYSIPNCLAALWQKRIDNDYNLPDLYIIQIAIGAQGVTSGYMWHPDREEKLVPGKLGEVDISLFPFCKHIFSLLDESFVRLNKEYEIIGLHWRGGENDALAKRSILENDLKNIYERILSVFNALLANPPIVLHKLVCSDNMRDIECLENMNYINTVFENLRKRFNNISVFDPSAAPQYIPDVRGNGLFIEDAIHFKPEVNKWISEEIIRNYIEK